MLLQFGRCGPLHHFTADILIPQIFFLVPKRSSLKYWPQHRFISWREHSDAESAVTRTWLTWSYLCAFLRGHTAVGSLFRSVGFIRCVWCICHVVLHVCSHDSVWHLCQNSFFRSQNVISAPNLCTHQNDLFPLKKLCSQDNLFAQDKYSIL